MAARPAEEAMHYPDGVSDVTDPWGTWSGDTPGLVAGRRRTVR